MKRILMLFVALAMICTLFMACEKKEGCEHSGGTATCLKRAVCEKCQKAYGLRDPDNHAKGTGWVVTEHTHERKYLCCEKVVVEEAEHNVENYICKDCNLDFTPETEGTTETIGEMTGEGISYKDEDAVTHYATIEIENYGTIKLELYGKVAPETVENFENLANKGFYNGLTFHRIMQGFMMQGGDPKGDGTGGNEDENGIELNIRGEFEVNGHYNDISHVRGVISMARNGYSYDSASSQFFIVQKDSAHLDGQYAGFGRVIEGMGVVDSICESSNPIDDNGTISKEEQPKIKSIRVEKAN